MPTLFTESWHNRRRMLILERMEAAKVDCLVLSNSASHSLFYLTGLDILPNQKPIWAFFKSDGQSAVMAPACAAETIVEGCPWIHARFFYNAHDNMGRQLHAIRERLGISRSAVLAVDDAVEFYKFEELRAAFPQARFQKASAVTGPVMTCKTPEELRILREAHHKLEQTYASALKQVHTGISELEFSFIIQSEAFQNGFQPTVSTTEIAFGKNSSFVHRIPGQRTLFNHQTACCDLRLMYKHYWAGMSRCFSLGTPPAGYRKMYEICREGQMCAERSICAGKTFHEICSAAGEYFRQKGVLEYWSPCMGHGIGLTADEPPIVSDRNLDVLEPGMVFTLAPVLRVPGYFGVSVGNTVVVTENGYEPLTNYPLGFHLLNYQSCT